MRIEILYKYIYKFELHNLTNGKTIVMNETEFRHICYYLISVYDVIKTVADSLAIDPIVLEWMVRCVDYLDPLDLNKIKDALKQDSAKYIKEDNCIILTKGVVDTYIPLHRLKSEIDLNILPVMNMLPWKHFVILVTTKHTDLHSREPMAFANICDEFEVLDKEIKIQHLKGLGEMSPEALKFTTVDPNTRSQACVTSIGDLDVLYQMLGVDVKHRKTMMTQ